MVNNVNEIRSLIQKSKYFYITGHTNPDGDSIGACFGLGLALKKMGKKVRVLLEPFHHKYDVIPGQHLMYMAQKVEIPQVTISQRTVCGQKDVDQAQDSDLCLIWTEAVLICVDCADINRLTDCYKTLAQDLSYIISIDHHYSNTHFANHNFVDEQASSTCEMIYRILDGFVELDQNIAAALYAGIAGDTGGFRYSSTSQDTMQIAGKLISFDIPFTDIYTELLHRRSYTEVKLLERVLANCLLSAEGTVIHACVTQEMMTGFEGAPDATPQDLDGMVEYLLNIRGAKIALLVYDCCHDGDIKVSLRSRNVNVGSIAQQLGGGGHHLAAGATVKGDIFQIRDKVLSLIRGEQNIFRCDQCL